MKNLVEQDLIKRCLESGWRLSPTPIEQTQSLIPPEGDPRINWCAIWEKIVYEGSVVLVPHWAQPGTYKDSNERRTDED